MLGTFFVIFTGIVTIIWAWSRKVHSFFSKHGVPEAKAWFPLGSSPTWKMFSGTPFTTIYNDLYKEHKGNKLVGFYGPLGSQQLLVLDLEMAKNVLVKDFEYFQGRREFAGFNNQYLDNMLTQLEGEKWRQSRHMITPIFTGGKLKLMLHLIDKIGDKMVDHLEKYADEQLEFDTKDMMVKYSLEVIASTAFGVEAQAFSDPNGIFADRVEALQSTGKYKRSTLEVMRFFIIALVLPKSISKYLPKKWMEFFDPDVVDFFIKIMKGQLAERRKNPSQRMDFIDHLTQAVEAERSKGTGAFESEEELEVCVIANAFVMFFAGFDTSSTNSSLCAFFLAKNQDCQKKLYEEVREAVEANGGNQNLDYATLQKLPYLDACLTESMRCYPLVNLERTVSKPYKLPGTNLTLPKGMLVTVPGAAINNDPQYWENPEKFNPDHFSEESVSKRANGQYADTSFGHGPRNCVGKRMALLQIRVALVRLIYNYKLLPCSKTIDEMVPDIQSSGLLPKGGMWVKIEKRM